MSRLGKRSGGVAILTTLVVGMIFGLALPAHAADSDDVTITGTVGDRDISTVDTNDPLELTPGEDTVVAVTITNGTGAPLTVRTVRLDAQVAGLTFFTFSTRVDLTVPAGGVGERSFTLSLDDLGDQATGLLPGRLAAIDQQRDVVASERFAVDVRGRLFSVYGVFGLAVAAITLLLLVAALIRLTNGTLSANRWSRAARFATVGLGLGLTLTFTLSALRLAVPGARTWVLLLIIGTAVGFVVGYLTPTPDYDDDEDDDSDVLNLTERADDLDQYARQPYPQAPGGAPTLTKPVAGSDPGRTTVTSQSQFPPPPPNTGGS